MKKIGLVLAVAAIAVSTVPASAWVARGGGGWRNGGWVAHGGWGYRGGCCWGGGWGGVAAGVAAGAAVGAIGAAAVAASTPVVAAPLYTLPPACVAVPGGYYTCSGVRYRAVYSPNGVVYQVAP